MSVDFPPSSFFQPFDVELQWLVATGPVMSDLVYGWSRKIKNNPGVLHLLPMPDDPFCHPNLTLYTDPLRFVPCNPHIHLTPNYFIRFLVADTAK